MLQKNLQRLLPFLGMWALLALVPAAQAQQESGLLGMRLLGEPSAVGSEPILYAGLEVALKEPWHTYWRNPGDSGLAPVIDWAGSQNVRAVELLYPAPIRERIAGIEMFGYPGTVVFPLRVMPERLGEAVQLKLRADVLVCDDICIPETRALERHFPAGLMQPTAEAALVRAALARVPKAEGGHGLTVQDVRADVVDNTVVALTVRVAAQPPLVAPDLMLEHDPAIYADPPEVLEQKDGVALLRVPLRTPAALVGHPVRMTLVDGTRAIETVENVQAGIGGGASSAAMGAGGEPASLPSAAPEFWLILLMAFVGGFILNFMPCVLPVLSLKVLGVLGHGGAALPLVRWRFLASIAGILFSFLVLAGLVIALKMAGMSVGWGIQFQNPLFLSFLILVLALFAANLWGWFEVPVPSFVQNMAGTAQHPGRHPVRSKLAGDFMTGMLATLLATPCTAPFLGTAVGFALVADTPIILLVFLVMGLGLALPYFVFAVWPERAARLPRPGGWMNRVRLLLGFALLATAAWLLWVLSAQLNTALLAAVAVAVAGLLALLYLRTRKKIPALGVGALLLALAVPGLAVLHGPGERVPFSEALDSRWRPFAPADIAGHVAAGQRVFVDVTADWCLTCQVNKKVVLDRPDISAQLFAAGVVAMQADWTLPNDGIAAYLRAHQRGGIPFNIVYGPGAPNGIILPEILTIGAVEDALSRAK